MKSLSNLVSAIDWEAWECCSQCNIHWREMFCDRRNTNRCFRETQENTYMNKVRGRKRKENVIFD